MIQTFDLKNLTNNNDRQALEHSRLYVIFLYYAILIELY